MLSTILSPLFATNDTTTSTTPNNHSSTSSQTRITSTTRSTPSSTPKAIEFSFDHFKYIQLPTELWLYILQYLQVPDLDAFSRCDSTLFHFIMCRDVKRENSFTFTIKNWFSNTIETSKEQVEYQRVQQLIWKPMLLRYFPRFQVSKLETRVKNYLTVLQRRLRYIQQQDDKQPLLQRQIKYSARELFRMEQERQHEETKMQLQKEKELNLEEDHLPQQQDLTQHRHEQPHEDNPRRVVIEEILDIEDYYDNIRLNKTWKHGYKHILEDNFIENCQWVYKCPLNFTQLADEFKNSAMCSYCNERVYRVRNEHAFKYHSDMGHCVAFTYKGEKKIGCVLY
ncbi:hypothetical protein FDP41_001520 [Naegleria fowleri]|uniref:F-box domain-containing protein n=1 Tax=Naegleria fowleri TaxID=5763 RepID=A0A6A5BPZ2_NAEFO|nr:uncharacterized protein FDP41_001520 [Naegleria fowleri]KAF0979177.1 hypothetical protein FDP41_001520 [Naegleria fowleri]CAG4707823.1 unnamed protein product [Naegleria fowleri]